MLDKINSTVMLVIGFVFGVIAIWGLSVPISQAVVEQLWAVVLAILSSLGIITGTWAQHRQKNKQ